MRDPDPFRWDAQTPVTKIGLIATGIAAAALLLVVLVILAGFLWHAIVWVRS